MSRPSTMTSSPSASHFDTGPLSWVIGEIRDALERSGSALFDAAARSLEAQPTLLLHAKTHLHQAHGALQMVDVEGVGLLTAAAERALDAFKDRAIDCTPEHAKVVREAYGAIGEYLDELVAGPPLRPSRGQADADVPTLPRPKPVVRAPVKAEPDEEVSEETVNEEMVNEETMNEETVDEETVNWSVDPRVSG